MFPRGHPLLTHISMHAYVMVLAFQHSRNIFLSGNVRFHWRLVRTNIFLTLGILFWRCGCCVGWPMIWPSMLPMSMFVCLTEDDLYGWLILKFTSVLHLLGTYYECLYYQVFLFCRCTSSLHLEFVFFLWWPSSMPCPVIRLSGRCQPNCLFDDILFEVYCFDIQCIYCIYFKPN